uniref:Secreted protein n=1 Tax=Ditylenchus dipsaci TaxID=166011 RepID=A0A915EPP5_9BILA
MLFRESSKRNHWLLLLATPLLLCRLVPTAVRKKGQRQGSGGGARRLDLLSFPPLSPPCTRHQVELRGELGLDGSPPSQFEIEKTMMLLEQLSAMVTL